jgi:HPt (histidine-containing phosphotransfer) domain-containing protein
MVDLFRAQIKEYCIEMPKLLAKGDYINLSRVAHKAKSSVAVMGMKKEADLLSMLEINARNGVEIESFKTIIDTFIEIATEAVKELDDQLKKS